MMYICETKSDCPYVYECEDKIRVTTYDDLSKGIEKFISGRTGCQLKEVEE